MFIVDKNIVKFQYIVGGSGIWIFLVYNLMGLVKRDKGKEVKKIRGLIDIKNEKISY